MFLSSLNVNIIILLALVFPVQLLSSRYASFLVLVLVFRIIVSVPVSDDTVSDSTCPVRLKSIRLDSTLRQIGSNQY